MTTPGSPYGENTPPQDPSVPQNPYGAPNVPNYSAPPEPQAPQNPYGQATPSYQAAPEQPAGYPAAPTQQGYGYPAAPGAVGFGAPAAPARPVAVLIASILLFVGAGLVAFMGIFAATVGPAALSGVLGSLPAESVENNSAEVQGLAGIVLGMMVAIGVIMVICAALSVVVGIFTLKGSNAWRIVGTVCGGLWILLLIFSMFGDSGSTGNSNVGGNLLIMAWNAAIIVLWWLPVTNQWFAAKSAQRNALGR